MTFAKKFLADLAKLKLPVTAAAVATLALNVAAPFGLHINAEVISAGLLGIGVIAAYVSHLLSEE